MSILIPSDPSVFFTEFLPARFAESRALPSADTAGRAAFVVDRVGAWSFQVRNEVLEVEEGVRPETVMQVGVSRSDFDGLFVERTRRKVAEAGGIPADLLMVFLPLFVDQKKKAVADGAEGSLRVDLDDHGATYEVTLTPGSGNPTEPKTIVRMRLEDFLGLMTGDRGIPGLLLRGRLKIRGETAHALRLSGLLG